MRSCWSERLVYLALICATFLISSCGGRAIQEDTTTTDSTSFTPEVKTLSEPATTIRSVRHTIVVYSTDEPGREGFYIEVLKEDRVPVFTKKVIDDLFHDVTIDETISIEVVDGKPVIYFSVFEKEQGSAYDLYASEELYMIEVENWKFTHLRYAGVDMSFNGSNKIAGEFDSLPPASDTAQRKFLVNKILAHPRIACVSADLTGSDKNCPDNEYEEEANPRLEYDATWQILSMDDDGKFFVMLDPL